MDKHEAGALLGEYMAGTTDEAPWEAFGLSKQPVIGGVGPASLPAHLRV